MNHSDTLTVSSSNQNRRRRRSTPQQTYELKDSLIPSKYHHNNSDDNIGGSKGHCREDRVFKNSCFLGKLLLNSCLCLFNSTTSFTKRWHHRRNNRCGNVLGIYKKKFLLFYSISKILIIAIFLASGTKLPPLSLPSPFSLPPPLHPLTDEALNLIPMVIPVFDFERLDSGRWNTIRQFFQPTASLEDLHAITPDLGGLDIITHKLLNNVAVVDGLVLGNESLSSPRVIHLEDTKLASNYWETTRVNDPNLQSYDMHPEELQDTKGECRSPNWAKKYRPHCNMIHELTFGEEYDPERAKRPGYVQAYDSYYISYGAFRMVWVVHQQFPDNIKSALKTTRFKHDFNHRTFWNTLNDALIMERLTSSPRIVDIYGHCGGTVLVEAMPHEVEEIIIPGDGMMKQEDIPKELISFNSYTVEDKLDIALFMAESLADLHGFRDGVIVHDDVQLCQWLRTGDGRLKLGDFNRAEVMDYDEKGDKYCTYYNGGCGGNYRAPEEYDKRYLNEQIDVYSFGNNIYGLLTGLWVFYEVDDDEVVQERVIKGDRAIVDPRWKKEGFIESKLVELMEKCWRNDVDERIDIFAAVKELREVKNEHQRRKSEISVDERKN